MPGCVATGWVVRGARSLVKYLQQQSTANPSPRVSGMVEGKSDVQNGLPSFFCCESVKVWKCPDPFP